MFASRAPLMFRALKMLNRSPVNTVNKMNCVSPVLQTTRSMSAAWTYRSSKGAPARSVRIWAELLGASRFLPFNFNSAYNMFHFNGKKMSTNEVDKRNWLDDNSCFYYSYVVVDFLAFVLGLGTHCRRIPISRTTSLDKCRARNSTRRWRINEIKTAVNIWDIRKTAWK